MDEQQPTVSVVITTYYRNEILRDAIESVLHQTHTHVEVIVVDDSGEANAKPVMKDYPDIIYISLTRNHGPHAARSIGANQVSGDYVQFLDDDDMLHEEKFEKQLSLFSDNTGVIYCGIRIHETGEIKRPDPDKRGDVLEYALRVRLWEPACTPSLLIDHSVLEKVLPLTNRHGCDDDGLMLELAQRTEFDYVDEPLVEVRKDTDYSVSERLGGINGRWKLLDKYSSLYEQHPRNPRRYVLLDIYTELGNKELQTNVWSPRAIIAYAKAAYYAPEEKPKRVLILIASFLGQPGLQAAKTLRDFVKN